MKRVLIVLSFISLSFAAVLGQSLDSKVPPRLMRSLQSVEGVIKTIYEIECAFTDTLTDEQETIVRDPKNWQVRGPKRKFPLKKVAFNLADKDKCYLQGDWEIFDDLFVKFAEGVELVVQTEEALSGTTHWGFGKGKAIDINARRLMKQKSMYGFDFDLTIRIVELGLSPVGENFWFKSLSFAATSTGTIGSDEDVRNGTQSSMGLTLHPFYFVGGLIYQMKFNLAYQFETAMDASKPATGGLVNIINKHFKFGLEAEVPYTNYPIYKLHTVTGYVRLAMPLTLSVDYLPKGKDESGSETLSRLDFKARYELAFSPYFILQGEWHHSSFYNVPSGADNNASYYTAAIAQDLDAVKETLGFLKLLLGDSEEIRGKHFIFYRISSGRKAPAFQNLREQSFGFGTYF